MFTLSLDIYEFSLDKLLDYLIAGEKELFPAIDFISKIPIVYIQILFINIRSSCTVCV